MRRYGRRSCAGCGECGARGVGATGIAERDQNRATATSLLVRIVSRSLLCRGQFGLRSFRTRNRKIFHKPYWASDLMHCIAPAHTHTQNGPETVRCLYHDDRHSETIPSWSGCSLSINDSDTTASVNCPSCPSSQLPQQLHFASPIYTLILVAGPSSNRLRLIVETTVGRLDEEQPGHAGGLVNE